MITVIRSDLIKGALIAYLKTLTAVTSELVANGSSADEIRESNWQSDQFVYPNIRIRMIRNSPEDGECNKANISCSVMVFTEDQSSATSDELSGIISPYFQSRQFSVQFQGSTYHFSLSRSTLIPAVRAGGMVWRSEVMLEGHVSLIT